MLYAHYVQPPDVAYRVAAAQIADAKAEAVAAEEWAKANIKYYQPRGPRRIVAFVSPNKAGRFGDELLPREQREAILRACVDAGVPMLIWMAQPERPERAASVAAAQEDALAYLRMIGAAQQ